jgi:hypothetical protein
MPRQQRQLALLSWQTQVQGHPGDAQAAAAAVLVPRQQCQLSRLSWQTQMQHAVLQQMVLSAAREVAPPALQTVGAVAGCLAVLFQQQLEHPQAAAAAAAAASELAVVGGPALIPLVLLVLQHSAAAAAAAAAAVLAPELCSQ